MSVGVGLDEVELPSAYKRLNAIETERARQEYEEKRIAAYRKTVVSHSDSLATSVRAAAPNFRYQQNPNMSEKNKNHIPPPINHRHSTDADAVKKYKQYVNSTGFRNK